MGRIYPINYSTAFQELNQLANCLCYAIVIVVLIIFRFGYLHQELSVRAFNLIKKHCFRYFFLRIR